MKLWALGCRLHSCSLRRSKCQRIRGDAKRFVCSPSPLLCFSLVSLTLHPQPSLTLSAIMFLTFFCRIAATSEKAKIKRRSFWLFTHMCPFAWHGGGDKRKYKCVTVWVALEHCGCNIMCQQAWINFARSHFELLRFLNVSVVYREMSPVSLREMGPAKTSTS